MCGNREDCSKLSFFWQIWPQLWYPEGGRAMNFKIVTNSLVVFKKKLKIVKCKIVNE